MTTNTERATEIIRDVLAQAWNAGPIFDTRKFPDAAARALADAGLLMPNLPAPMQRGETERAGGTPGSRWYGYEDDGNDDGSEMYSPHRYIDSHPGEVWIDGHVLLSPEDARAYALALIAAANHAEQENKK